MTTRTTSTSSGKISPVRDTMLGAATVIALLGAVGTARETDETRPCHGEPQAASPLNVYDFIKISSIIALDEATSRQLSALAVEIAEAETLSAHASAARRRIEGSQRSVWPANVNPINPPADISIRTDGYIRTYDPSAAVRPHIREMPAYEPILRFEVLSAQLGFPADQLVKLDANENPYGPLPQALEALGQLQYAHIYPDPESRLLRQALAAYHGLPVENLLAGAGADELIDLVMEGLPVLQPERPGIRTSSRNSSRSRRTSGSWSRTATS